MFKLRKSWMYTIKASPERCNAAFSAAFTEKRSLLSSKRAHWSVSDQTVPGEDGIQSRAIVATMDRANALREMSRGGRAGAGSSIAFTIDSHDASSGVTSCQMFLLEGKRYRASNVSPAVVANADILKAQMRLVHKKLTAIDPQLGHEKTW